MSAYSGLSDHELMLLLKEGDHAAYLQIYDRYKSPLQQYGYKKLGVAADVKDVLQELFTDLWHKRDTITLSSTLSGYLFTSVRNRSLNVIYRRRKETDYLDSLQEFIEAGNNLTDLTLREREFAQLIADEINALPPKMKEVFMMSRNEGLSHQEIAERLGKSETTVSKQVSNALKILRVKLGSLFFLLF